MTLEQQIAAVLRSHNLTSLSIIAHMRADGEVWFQAYAHAPEGCGAGACSGPDTSSVKAAAASAIGDVVAIRARSLGVEIDAALPEGLAA